MNTQHFNGNSYCNYTFVGCRIEPADAVGDGGDICNPAAGCGTAGILAASYKINVQRIKWLIFTIMVCSLLVDPMLELSSFPCCLLNLPMALIADAMAVKINFFLILCSWQLKAQIKTNLKEISN